jgi:hypothetical protein
LHVQTTAPVAIEQDAFGSQPPFASWHVSFAAHASPVPVKPVLQAQANTPVALVHVALGSHVRLFATHPLIATQS